MISLTTLLALIIPELDVLPPYLGALFELSIALALGTTILVLVFPYLRSRPSRHGQQSRPTNMNHPEGTLLALLLGATQFLSVASSLFTFVARVVLKRIVLGEVLEFVRDIIVVCWIGALIGLLYGAFFSPSFYFLHRDDCLAIIFFCGVRVIHASVD